MAQSRIWEQLDISSESAYQLHWCESMGKPLKGAPIMPDTPEPGASAGPKIQERLHDIAQLLRLSSSIDPETQRTLAELVDELSKALQGANLPLAEVTHLAETTSHLAESLHQQQDRGFLARMRDRLEQAVSNAEIHAPTAVGLARKLLEELANIGI
jgi:hypothetical protein